MTILFCWFSFLQSHREIIVQQYRLPILGCFGEYTFSIRLNIAIHTGYFASRNHSGSENDGSMYCFTLSGNVYWEWLSSSNRSIRASICHVTCLWLEFAFHFNYMPRFLAFQLDLKFFSVVITFPPIEGYLTTTLPDSDSLIISIFRVSINFVLEMLRVMTLLFFANSLLDCYINFISFSCTHLKMKAM